MGLLLWGYLVLAVLVLVVVLGWCGYLGALEDWTLDAVWSVLWWGGHSEDALLCGLLVTFCLGMSWASATLGLSTVAPASN